MHLSQYPEAIAYIQRQILNLDRGIYTFTENANLAASRIEREINSDPSFKTKAQRKAAYLEMLQTDPNHVRASAALGQFQTQKEELLIELEYLRNKFNALQLEMQTAIALRVPLEALQAV